MKYKNKTSQTKQKNKPKFGQQFGMYNPNQEKSACGVGMIAATDGKASRYVVDKGMEALGNLSHRGAVDADGKTGDGAGIHIELPKKFFMKYLDRFSRKISKGTLCAGMIFLPRTSLNAQEKSRQIVETHILSKGWKILAWRQVPINTQAIGDKANLTRPEIEQVLFLAANNKDDEQLSNRLEKDLYIIRRKIEKEAIKNNISSFYICSFSSKSIIYKGLFLAEQLSDFYPDLLEEDFISSFAIYHQRYSTNTFPSWQLAQPLRVISHNGEINTITGNKNWMKSHESKFANDEFGSEVADIKPVIYDELSDSGALDATYEILIHSKRKLSEASMMLIPENYENNPRLDAKVKDFYTYACTAMEPWDGPAAICGYCDDWLIATLDRNGLRPLRYIITDKLLILGSESGMVQYDPVEVLESGNIGAGEMIAVDIKAGRIYFNDEIKLKVANLSPFSSWKNKIKLIVRDNYIEKELNNFDSKKTNNYLINAGWSHEDLEEILRPMVETGVEATGAMGDDSAHAFLSEEYRMLHHYLKQNFAQVTNPAIDSLREKHIMSLTTRIDNLGNILEKDAEDLDILQLSSPILDNSSFEKIIGYHKKYSRFLDTTFIPKKDNLSRRISELQKEAEQAVLAGARSLILSDEAISKERALVPMLLASGAVHQHLLKKDLRSFCSLIIKTSEALDTHSFATIIGVGGTACYPWLTLEVIKQHYFNKLYLVSDIDQALNNYIKAIEKGLLKIMAKMGISVVSSYRGGYQFEAVGLSRTLTAEFFPQMPSRISGLGLNGLENKIVKQHTKAWSDNDSQLDIGGFYKYRENTSNHAWQPEVLELLQKACKTASYSTYKKYIQKISSSKAINICDMLEISSTNKSIAIDEVESTTRLRRRIVSPAISLGAISPVTHETIAIAMNRIGARSNSGEGGEDSKRYKPFENGDNANSNIKQIASGRFGVTAEYLNNCQEIEIKVAQGAKPGEGGQLPGYKVSKLIAKLRHSNEHVTLISPPPHHDIYSIEDLAQLIYDLKQINPRAEICVKLVARYGVGTVAAGVAKAKADIILISGHSGGTAASSKSSIKFAGLPWEMGLAEVHQVLTINNLRHLVKLRVDGGIKTSRDIAIATMLGAEEFGIGTASLISLGCLMVRQCHSNTCPVGICSQDEELTKFFHGKAENLINLISFVIEDLRELLAKIGIANLNDLIGQTQYLRQVSRGSKHLDDLDLNPLLVKVENVNPVYCTRTERNKVEPALDDEIIKDAYSLFLRKEKIQLHYLIKNTHRSIGARLSSKIIETFGVDNLPNKHVSIKLVGTAGQSLGAFLTKGVFLELVGEANDYVGKGLSGGEIVLRRPKYSELKSHKNVICGNTVLYGATSGSLFAAGRAGERFAIRNSGALAVIEGVGSNGLEYMTAGFVLILGEVGDNLAAGMTGGQAVILAKDLSTINNLINFEHVEIQQLKSKKALNKVYELINIHANLTNSNYANRIISNWQSYSEKFIHLYAKESIKNNTFDRSLNSLKIDERDFSYNLA